MGITTLAVKGKTAYLQDEYIQIGDNIFVKVSRCDVSTRIKVQVIAPQEIEVKRVTSAFNRRAPNIPVSKKFEECTNG